MAGKQIDLEQLEREMTNRANSRETTGMDIDLWREPGHETRACLFINGRSVSICGRLTLREDLIDPRAHKENPVRKCHECSRMLPRGEWG